MRVVTSFLVFILGLLVIWYMLHPPPLSHNFTHLELPACRPAAEYKTFFLTFLLEFLFILAARVYYLVSYYGLKVH